MMRSRKPQNQKADREFSAKVLGRDGRVCRLQRWNGKAWVEHGTKGYPHNPIEACHIYSRARIANDEVHFNPLVGVAGCKNCHDVLDGRVPDKKDTVRVPPSREDTAWRYLERQVVLGILKLLPTRRIPPERPEAA